MQGVPGLYLETEMVLPVFMITAGAFVLFSFIAVLLIRSVPAKLVFLGVLMMTAGIVFSAIVPAVKTLAWVMVIVAAVLVLAGLVCAIVSYAIQLVKSTKPPSTS